MCNELVQRLREPCQYENCVLCQQAADAIERLSRECKVLYAMLGTHPDPKGEMGDPGILRELPKEGE